MSLSSVSVSRFENIDDNMLGSKLLPFIVSALPKSIPNRNGSRNRFNEGFVTPIFIEILDEVHRLAEQFVGLNAVVGVNRHFSMLVKRKRNELGKKITTKIDIIRAEPWGTKCIRECVDSRWYLTALRVFFTFNPSALNNNASSPTHHDGFKRTILHNAVSPNNWEPVPSFVRFILQMNTTYQLGLLGHQEGTQVSFRPIQRAVNQYSYNQCPLVAEVLKLLVAAGDRLTLQEMQKVLAGFSTQKRRGIIDYLREIDAISIEVQQQLASYKSAGRPLESESKLHLEESASASRILEASDIKQPVVREMPHTEPAAPLSVSEDSEMPSSGPVTSSLSADSQVAEPPLVHKRHNREGRITMMVGLIFAALSIALAVTGIGALCGAAFACKAIVIFGATSIGSTWASSIAIASSTLTALITCRIFALIPKN